MDVSFRVALIVDIFIESFVKFCSRSANVQIIDKPHHKKTCCCSLDPDQSTQNVDTELRLTRSSDSFGKQ